MLQEFSGLLKQEYQEPVYLILGNETVLISRLLRAIKKNVLAENADDFCFSSFYGSSSDAPSILAEAQQIPFLAPKRLIFVKEVERFSADDLNLLAEYFESPVPSTVMVLIASSVDKRTKFYKALSKSTPIIELNTPSIEEMREWVEKRCRHEGKTILPDALELLMTGGAASLTLLTQEVEKLLLLAKDQPQITLTEVIQISSRSKLKTIFDLWESIAIRKRDLAFYILRELQQDRISIQELIGLFRWQLSRLFQGQEMVQAGRASKKEIASALKIPFFVADKFLTQLRQFPHKRIEQAYHSILKADEELKVGSRQEKEIIDFLLYRLMA